MKLTPDLDGILYPDTDMAEAATALLRGVSGQTMINHCLRSYRYGAAIGKSLGRKPDAEALFIAAVLHDLGLEAPYDGPGDFEKNGAVAAERFLLSKGYAEKKASLIHDAILLHTDLAAGADARDEVALLHLGTLIDITGLRLDEIPEKEASAILDEFPRLGCKALFRERIGAQISAKPDCHIAHVSRDQGMLQLLDVSSFDDWA